MSVPGMIIIGVCGCLCLAKEKKAILILKVMVYHENDDFMAIAVRKRCTTNRKKTHTRNRAKALIIF